MRPYFNPPTPRGVGRRRLRGATNFAQFQSTHPARGGTVEAEDLLTAIIFQSTHPARGGTRIPQRAIQRAVISIHPPREGWDCSGENPRMDKRYFNPPTPRGVGLRLDVTHLGCALISIHPPREGWDPCKLGSVVQFYGFQSTHPARGGTQNFFRRNAVDCISIHPPREGWDHIRRNLVIPPVRISIHPPREGWDNMGLVLGQLDRDFNPPTPRGVGPHPGF